MKTRKSGPLQGLRVVTLPSRMAAKIMGMVLADNGATVVELQQPQAEVEPGWEFSEQAWRRGKDLVSFENAEQLGALIGEADVFITDFYARDLKKLNAFPPDLMQRHPALVSCYISGYGLESKRLDEEWSDMLVTASMGFPWRQPGYREGPRMPTFPAGSYGVVFNGLSATLAAIHARNATGAGQVVDISIVDGLMSQQALNWNWSEKEPAPSDFVDIHRGGMGRLVLEAYQCADGESIHIHSGSKGGFSRLMKLAELQDQIPPIPTEAASEIGQPIEDWQLELIHSTLPAMFYTKTRDEWLKIFRDLDIAAMSDLLAGEIFADRQSLENQLSTLVELPTGENIRVAGAVLKFSETPGNAASISERRVSQSDAVEDLKRAVRRTPPPAFGKGKLSDKYPLAGIRIVDFGIFFAGPFASRILSDLGADVIKIENLAGCPMRPVSKGRYFNAANHSKRTLALNLKKPESRPIIEKLVKWADIVQHNLRPGVAESMSMAYEDLRDFNSKLIYMHSPAFGSLGPDRDLPGFEPLSSAIAGILMRHADCRDVGPYSAIGNMDPGNGMLGAAALLMALYHRDRTGEGQFIECPQLGSAILSTSEALIRQDGTVIDPYKADAEQWGFAWWKRIFKTKDGWLVVDAWTSAARTQLLELARADETTAEQRLTAWMAERDTQSALKALRDAGVPAEAIGETYKAGTFFFNEENVRMRRVLEFKATKKWGDYRDLGQFARLSASPVREASDGHFAHEIGENTRDILREHGVSDAEIAQLAEKRVIGLG